MVDAGGSVWDAPRRTPTVGFDKLDEFQRAFCTSEAENVRVLAPAGSGKTETLLWRCAELYERDRSAHFLIVTFTTAARAELQERLREGDFGNLGSAAEPRTLNSWGWEQVRKRYRRSYLAVRNQDKADCVNGMGPSLGDHPQVLKSLRRTRWRAARLLSCTDTLKNFEFRLTRDCTEEEFRVHWDRLSKLGLEPQLDRFVEDLRKMEVLDDPAKGALQRALTGAPAARGAELGPRGEVFARFFPFAVALFGHMLRRRRFTLEDQKYVALRLIEADLERGVGPDSRAFTHVLVDEFQDISPLDLALVRAIARRNGAALTIVGDDDQAIFEWRGGSPRYLLEPERQFDHRRFETHVLERNYRCPRNIVRCADRLIRHNRLRHEKRMEAVGSGDAEVVTLTRRDPADSVTAVMGEVDRFLATCGKDDRMALLSRKIAHLVPYQILFADKGLRFEAADDLKIFLSRAFERLIQMLKIRARRDVEGVSARQVVGDMRRLCRQVAAGDRDRRFRERVERGLNRRLPSSYFRAWETLVEVQKAVRVADDLSFQCPDYAGAIEALFRAKTVEETVVAISRRFEGLAQDFGRGATDIFYRDPPFRYLGAVAKRFGDDFTSFLRTLDRARMSARSEEGEDKLARSGSRRSDAPVHFTTALRAKGKQFHTVVILNTSDGEWPPTFTRKDAEEQRRRGRRQAAQALLEAERRVFYVAMTRVQKRLVLSASHTDAEGKPLVPSPYITEAGLQDAADETRRRSAALPQLPRPDEPRAAGRLSANGEGLKRKTSASARRSPASRGPGAPGGARAPDGRGLPSVSSVGESAHRSESPADEDGPGVGSSSVIPGPKALEQPPPVLRPGEGAVLDAPDLAALVGGGESAEVEFKSTLRCNLHTGKRDRRMETAVLKTLAAFLNTDGGTLVIGVRDDGVALGLDADGFANEDKMGQHLVNIGKARMGATTMTSVKLSFDSLDGHRVLVARCSRSRKAVWLSNGDKEAFYVRTGATTTELKPSEAHDYILSSGRFSRERQ